MLRCWDRKGIMSSERESLRTSKLLRQWSMLWSATASYNYVYCQTEFLHTARKNVDYVVFWSWSWESVFWFWCWSWDPVSCSRCIGVEVNPVRTPSLMTGNQLWFWFSTGCDLVNFRLLLAVGLGNSFIHSFILYQTINLLPSKSCDRDLGYEDVRMLRPSIPTGWRLRKRQPVGMFGQSSGNHDWLLANASDCVWMETGVKIVVNRTVMKIFIHNTMIAYTKKET